jgi:hypothetical protein
MDILCNLKHAAALRRLAAETSKQYLDALLDV